MSPHPFRTAYYTLALTTCLVGCSAPSGSDPTEAHAALTTPTLPVHVVVLTRDDGSGNPLWTPDYARAVLDTATALTGHTVTLTLASHVAMTHTDTYRLRQRDALYALRPLAMRHRLTVVISRPDTEDSAGISTTERAYEPLVVIRARVQDHTGLDETARILLHEVGHQLNLHHIALPAIGLCCSTDDYYLREDGRDFLAEWVAEITE